MGGHDDSDQTVGVMSGDSMTLRSMRYLFDLNRKKLVSGKEGFDEVGGPSMEVIIMAQILTPV